MFLDIMESVNMLMSQQGIVSNTFYMDSDHVA